MEILVTGNISRLKNDFFTDLAEHHKMVVCGPGADKIDVDKVSPYNFEIGQNEFEKMFLAYNFDYIVYFSYVLDREGFQEMESLDKIFSLCRKRDQIKVVYVTCDKSVSIRFNNTHNTIERACDELCRGFSQEGRTLLKLSVPELVSAAGNTGAFDAYYAQMEQRQCFETPYRADHRVDYLFGSDLAAFVIALFEVDENGYMEQTLFGGNERSVSELAELLERSAGYGDYDIRKNYGERFCETTVDKQKLRSRYGWFPKEKLDHYTDGWYREYKEASAPRKKWTWDPDKNGMRAGIKGKLLNFVEVALLFALCEVLNAYTRDMALVDFADFRLFFAAITGMMYGLRYGVFGAAAVCLSYAVSLGGGVNWQIQFYNIANWLPFATYLLTGAIAGYTKDRYQNLIQDAQKSQKVMEDKYIYLNELYSRTLENKENYRNQIVNYKNSFGRIYAASRQLNSMMSGEIFYQAITVLEDMLGTQRVAIYSLDGGNFARLNACSRGLTNTLTKSIRLDAMPDCMRVLEKSETWVNRERLEGYPDYAYAIYRDSVLSGLIMIYDVEYEHMGIEYLNRFNIISGLISDALIRAARFQQVSESEVMVADTRIMKHEPFMEELAVQQHLKEKNRANYILLRVFNQGEELSAVSARLLNVTRKNDIMGIGSDGGTVYILMTQADKGSLDIIRKRLEGGGITAEVVSTVD